MKKVILAMFLALFAFTAVSSYAADEDDYSTKGIMLQVGSGTGGLNAGLGFRYNFASLTISAGGFSNDIPNYSMIPPTGVVLSASQPLPSGFSEKEYTGLLVTFDFGFHLEMESIYPFTPFVTAGFYTQQDTILAKRDKEGDYFRFREQNTSGFCMGVGTTYEITEWLCLGVGYHTKRGIFGQLEYIW